MSHGQHTTRRAFFKGAAATILAGTVAGTALATQDPCSWWTPEMWEWAADGTLAQYERYGVTFIPQPGGRMFRSVYVGEDTAYDHVAVTELDEKMKSSPKLWTAVLNRVRELHAS